MAKTKLSDHTQYVADGERLKELAVGLCCDAFVSEPADLLELLCIFGRNSEFNQTDLLDIIATEIYPFSDEGGSAKCSVSARIQKRWGVAVAPRF